MAEGLGGCFGALLECEIDRLCWIIFIEKFHVLYHIHGK